MTALRWDVVLQARNGFYWATAFLVFVFGALLFYVSESIQQQAALWVPATILANLQITTFFFVGGLMLLEKDEGTLSALAVSPLSSSGYLTMRIVGLTVLAAAETFLVVWLGFGTFGAWPYVVAGTTTLGIIYTALGVLVAARYESVNALLLPASVVILMLMLPLLPHFGLVAGSVFVLHPLEPALTLLRGAYRPLSNAEVVFALIGCMAWSTAVFVWADRSVRKLMRRPYAAGGR